jgi:hypothetical protein
MEIMSESIKCCSEELGIVQHLTENTVYTLFLVLTILDQLHKMYVTMKN